MLINKKGSFLQDNIGWVILLTIAILIVLGIIPIFGKNTATSISCTTDKCKAECEAGEIQWYYDPSKTCEKINQKCCLLKSKTEKGTVTNTECTGKKTGDRCSSGSEYYYCDAQSQCVVKCDFCAINPTHNLCKKTVSGVDFNSNFICGCTKTECEGLRGQGKCTKSGAPAFCYLDAAYCCEK